MLAKLGFEVINLNKEKLQERYKSEGMSVFYEALSDCDALAFRSFIDLKIGAGVHGEILKAIGLGKIIFELLTITEQRILSIEETRDYLMLMGYR